MNQLPRVSIVTPSFNQAPFLETTIRSVVEQDYPDIEYVVVDGGSTDGSQEIIKRYADRIAFWVSERDNGQSDAINKGFRKCTGDIVAWINSDDVYVEGAIPLVARYFAEHPDVDMVHGDIDFIDGRGKFISKVKTADFTLPELLVTNRVSQPSVFWRRKLFDEIGYLDESFHYVMDYDFWIRVAMKHKVRHVGATVAQFRLHDTSKTISSNDLFLAEILIIIDRLLRGGDLPADVEEALFIHMQSALSGFRFDRMDKLQKYLEHDENARLRKLIELADYQSALSGRPVRYGDLRSIRAHLRDFFTGYVSQYDGYRRHVTGRSIDDVVEEEIYNISLNLHEKGLRRKSIKLFAALACSSPGRFKVDYVKRLLKQYVPG
ncbi:MAG: Glycosyltransferase AglE [Methanocella sp. PtaU1.Bin125]|nr:MAG: Glycosyltransferase AglE [Methanocella sp. PtaU1.Bin125]